MAEPRLIAAEDVIVDAWVYGGCLDSKITLRVVRQGWPDNAQFHFALHPDQAVTLAHQLLTLAAVAYEPIGEGELGETANEDGLFPEPERVERRFAPTDPPWPC